MQYHHQVRDLLNKTVANAMILAHEYYTHPESEKDVPSPEFMSTCLQLFENYLSKQIEIVKTVDDLKKHARNFVQLVIEEQNAAIERQKETASE